MCRTLSGGIEIVQRINAALISFAQKDTELRGVDRVHFPGRHLRERGQFLNGDVPNVRLDVILISVRCDEGRTFTFARASYHLFLDPERSICYNIA